MSGAEPRARSERLPKRPPFAMVPRAVVESGLDHACVRLYACIVGAAGPDGDWAVAGATDIGDKIEMQDETLLTHAQHLKQVGLIAYERHGKKKYEFWLLHNPSQFLVNPEARIPSAKPHARKPSKHSPPVPRGSAVAKTRSAGVRTPEDHWSERDPRPLTDRGRSKSASKSESVSPSSPHGVPRGITGPRRAVLLSGHLRGCQAPGRGDRSVPM